MENNTLEITLEYQKNPDFIKKIRIAACDYFDKDDCTKLYSYDKSVPKFDHAIEYLSKKDRLGLMRTTLCIHDKKNRLKKIIEEIFLADGISRIIFVNEYIGSKNVYFELITDIAFTERYPIKRRITRIGSEKCETKKIFLDSLITEHRKSGKRYDTSRDFTWKVKASTDLTI
jgi:hypothetical protein